MSPTTTAAAVISAGRRCNVEHLPLPEDLRGGALVAIEAAAVCGTDRAHYQDEQFWQRGSVVLGHENVGRVLAIDDAARKRWGVTIDDRVVVEETIPCGQCRDCRDGQAHRCPATDFRTPGALRYGRTPVDVWPGLWGGFAEHLYIHPRSWLHPVPEALDPHVAAFANPVANGLRWLGEVANVHPDETVLIIGPGSHGLGCVLAARSLGCDVLAAGTEGDDSRLQDARTLGARATFRTDGPDCLARCRELTRGRGPDVVVDLAPSATNTVSLAVGCVAVGGRVLLAGHKRGRTAGVDVDEVLRKEASLHGVRGPNRRSLAGAVRVLSDHTDQVRRINTQVWGLADVKRALDAPPAGTEAPSHVIVDPRIEPRHEPTVNEEDVRL